MGNPAIGRGNLFIRPPVASHRRNVICTLFYNFQKLVSFLQVSLDFRLDLPQVAVIGSQSSGKSSVLEALVSGILLTVYLPYI